MLNNSFNNFIERLRQRPHHQKKAIQMIVSLAVTGGICAMWLFNMFLGSGFSATAEASRTLSPIGTFMDSIGSAYGAIKNSVNNATSLFKN